MSYQYKNDKCPVCDKALGPGGDIVVCPECAAAYHRACYLANGKCVYEEHHGDESFFRGPAFRPEQIDGEAGLKCSSCGAKNPPDGIFCEICGTRLSGDAARDASKVGYNPYRFVPPPIPLNPYTTVFGGVDPAETIDGISVKDYSLFIGQNTHYFIPRFKRIAEKRGLAGFNWPALFLGFIYCFYRKMYLVGALLLAMVIVFDIPDILSLLNITGYEWLKVLPYISLVVSFAFGGLANFLYFRHAKAKLKAVMAERDEKKLPNGVYLQKVTNAGRVNLAAPIAVVAALFIVMFIVVYIAEFLVT